MEASIYLEDDECESTGASGVRVGLQVDVVNLTVLAKVLLDVQVLRLLGETSHKEFTIILAEMEKFIVLQLVVDDF